MKEILQTKAYDCLIHFYKRFQIKLTFPGPIVDLLKMSDIMPDCGGAWVPDDTGGGGQGQLPQGMLEQLSKLAGHGIVISGVITWMLAQMDTLAFRDHWQKGAS